MDRMNRIAKQEWTGFTDVDIAGSVGHFRADFPHSSFPRSRFRAPEGAWGQAGGHKVRHGGGARHAIPECLPLQQGTCPLQHPVDVAVRSSKMEPAITLNPS